MLKEAGCSLSIETNGTVEVDPIIDWICVSPKDQMYPDVKIRQTVGDELKVVYVGQDLEMYDDLKSGFNHLFLQPCYIDTDTVEENGRAFAAVEALVKQAPDGAFPFNAQMDGGGLMRPPAVMALSGGMDSTCLLLRLLAEGHAVTALGIDYGQRHRRELELAQRNVELLQKHGHAVTYNLVDLRSAMSALTPP